MRVPASFNEGAMAEGRREEGNALFSKGDFCAASVCYEQGMLRLSMRGRVRVEILRPYTVHAPNSATPTL